MVNRDRPQDAAAEHGVLGEARGMMSSLILPVPTKRIFSSYPALSVAVDKLVISTMLGNPSWYHGLKVISIV